MIVATVRALKMHGGAGAAEAPGGVGGAPAASAAIPGLPPEDVDAVRRGCENLAQHIRIVQEYGVPAIVAINAFPGDHASEYDAIREAALAAGARDAIVARHFAEGGEGAADLAEPPGPSRRTGRLLPVPHRR